MTTKIVKIAPLEILNSRGNPTVRVFCVLDNSIGANLPSSPTAVAFFLCQNFLKRMKSFGPVT